MQQIVFNLIKGILILKGVGLFFITAYSGGLKDAFPRQVITSQTERTVERINHLLCCHPFYKLKQKCC